MGKPRLRYTSKGWYRFWFKMLSGSKDIRTGVVLPDRDGAFEREFWVGPFASAREAFAAKPYA